MKYGEDWEEKFDEYKSFCSYRNSEHFYVNRLGKESGLLKWGTIQKKKSESTNKDSFIDKLFVTHGSDISYNQIQEHVSNRWDHVSLKAFVKKYGQEIGTTMYEEHFKNIRKKNPLCREYYEESDLSEDEISKLITKESMRRSDNIISTRSSKAATSLLKPIADKFIEKNITNHYCLEKEYKIILNEYESNISGNYFYYYDLTFPDLNIMIEYHGTRFHDDVDYNSTKNLTYEYFQKSFNRDLFKKFVAEQRNFTVIVLREWLLKEDKKLLLDFIHEKFKDEDIIWKKLLI